jgi:hypothetical protein
VIRVTGQRTHLGGGCVQQVIGMRRAVCLAQAVAAMPVNQDDPQRTLLCGCGVEQVKRDQRAAGAPADDRDERPAALGRIQIHRRCHSSASSW